MTLYQMPEWLGGQQFKAVDGGDDDGRIGLAVGDGRIMRVPVALVTAVAPILAPEPPVGSIGIDSDGDAWHHKDEEWWFGSLALSWADLNAQRGTITVYGAGPAAQPSEPAEALPFDFPDFQGRRLLRVDRGNRPGQIKFQVWEGQAFGRVAVLGAAEAEAAAWSVLAAVHGPGQVGGS